LLGEEEAEVTPRLSVLGKGGTGALVAELGGVVGCAAWAVIRSLDRPPLGRLTLLLVDESHRRRGIGAALIEAAEAEMARAGCTRVEALSEIDFSNAHGFFRRSGYERTSYRFAKALADPPPSD
jgi:GNAT superfamily N-acetyltransferase